MFVSLPPVDLLRVRAVCKRWKAKIDCEEFQSSPSTQSYCPVVFKKDEEDHAWLGYEMVRRQWIELPSLSSVPRVISLLPMAGNHLLPIAGIHVLITFFCISSCSLSCLCFRLQLKYSCGLVQFSSCVALVLPGTRLYKCLEPGYIFLRREFSLPNQGLAIRDEWGSDGRLSLPW